MTDYDWQHTVTEIIRSFDGDAPRAELEQRVLDVFRAEPELVIKRAQIVATQFKAGKVRSPWAILDLNLRDRDRPLENVVATDTTSRARAIAKSEQWVRAAGLHFDRETEVMSHLFGDRGQLRPYAQVDEVEVGRTDRDRPIPGWSEPTGDVQLVRRMVDLWHEVRETAIRMDEEAEERAEKWKEWKAGIEGAKAEARAELDAKQAPLEVGEDLIARAEREPVPS